MSLKHHNKPRNTYKETGVSIERSSVFSIQSVDLVSSPSLYKLVNISAFRTSHLDHDNESSMIEHFAQAMTEELSSKP